MSQLTTERLAELNRLCEQLERLVSHFYGVLFSANIGTQCHSFMEHCGLMGEHIHLLRDLLAQGIDFAHANGHGEAAYPIKSYRLKYLKQKFGCIFGPFGLRIEQDTSAAAVAENATAEPAPVDVFGGVCLATDAAIAELKAAGLEPQAMLSVASMLALRFIDAAGWDKAEGIKASLVSAIDGMAAAVLAPQEQPS